MKPSAGLPPIKMNRRQALLGSASLLSAASFGSILIGSGPARAQAFAPKYRLDVQETGSLLNRGMAYNGVFPGPVMRVSPGEALDIELVNSLPAKDDDCTDDMNEEHGVNTTNLHPHGLHVSPSFDSSGQYFSDNVFVSLVPQDQVVECAEDGHAHHGAADTHYVWGSANYRFELPEDHMTGTFWYHAHKHGATADQVGKGLAGPLIVEDVPGAMPDYIAEAKERILFLSNDGLIEAFEEGGGVTDPTLELAPGSVERWRIINGMGNGQNFHLPRLSLAGLEVYLIAYDGFTLEKRIPIDLKNADKPWLNPAMLSSGNRLDLIVHVPADYEEIENEEEAEDAARQLSIFDIDMNVSGDPVEMTWSEDDALPGSGLEPFDSTELPSRTIAFTRGDTIDGESFDGDVEQSMTLGTAEEWTVTNETGMVHVYHIHVNPFFVTHFNGEELPSDSPLRRWQDTLGVPTAANGTDGSTTFKTRFESFTGMFVIHCHVLAHEDRGMMQIVEVVDA